MGKIMWLCVLVLMGLCNTVVSKSLIKSLPGFPGMLPFKLETGYIGVGESEDVQLFYYFIESERNPSDDPLMLWLTGGPGCYALSGLIYEIGTYCPLAFDSGNSNGHIPTFVLNPYSWTKVLAVKKINSSALPNHLSKDFMDIVSDVSRLRHPNITELVGYCLEHGQHLLVYEFHKNGSLYDFLHLSDEFSKPLTWKKRVKIALGTARAQE
ncbi:serine carboxypeptidase-like 15 [Camellia sinensis]|uniref:serine carboxypeptidase-like 15 n=1 Tax=Camellia sinensis TaxID=4442 RepID=UPI001035CC49|nr:serine carboxypeptidase-like 15 [Camellia sinensis]